jgi:hypothetical protein
LKAEEYVEKWPALVFFYCQIKKFKKKSLVHIWFTLVGWTNTKGKNGIREVARKARKGQKG